MPFSITYCVHSLLQHEFPFFSSPIAVIFSPSLGPGHIFLFTLCFYFIIAHLFPSFHPLWWHLVGYLLCACGCMDPILLIWWNCKKPSTQFSQSDLFIVESICVGSLWLLSVDPSLPVSRITASWQTWKNNTMRWSVLPPAFQWNEVNRNGQP